jgi:hypothetical protein
MSEEQIEREQLALIKRVGELKRERAALESSLVRWRGAMRATLDCLDGIPIRHPGNRILEALPTGNEVLSALRGLQESNRLLGETLKLLRDMGFDLE